MENIIFLIVGYFLCMGSARWSKSLQEDNLLGNLLSIIGMLAGVAIFIGGIVGFFR